MRAASQAGVFYGWWIVLATMLLAVYYSGALFYSFTLLIVPIREDLGWGQAIISSGFLVQGILGAALAPGLGLLFDRVGPKPVVVGGMLAGGLGFLIVSRMTEPWHYYLGFALVGVGPIALWGGAIPAVANWFVRRRGFAIGLTGLGFSLGGLMAPISVVLIAAVGWRGTLFLMGLGVWLLLVPLALVLRRRPEDQGLWPDNAPPDPRVAPQRQPGAQEGLAVGRALRSPVFWMLVLTFSLAFWPMGGVQVHTGPYLEGVGLSRPLIAGVVTAMALVTVVGRLGGGWLADTTDARRATALALGLQAAGTAVFALVTAQRAWLLVPFLMAFAPGFGGMTVLQPALQGLYFGRRAFGAIQGAMWTITSLSFSVAPLALGELSERLGG
ncbi:MAG: MFS transporter, partial [Chloroflexi bacterium]|nr:MFS transporter [Chloroflexota bacterium]